MELQRKTVLIWIDQESDYLVAEVKMHQQNHIRKILVLFLTVAILPACAPTATETPVPISVSPTLALTLTPKPVTPTPVPLPTHGLRTPLLFSPLELPEAHVGQPYEVTITVSGNETPLGSISVNDAELPLGLTLRYEEDEYIAIIEGVPEKAGEFEFTVSAWCLGTNVNGQTGEKRYLLLVKQE
jgi:hypothetical protein